MSPRPWAGRAVTEARQHMARYLPAPCAAHTSTRCLGTIHTPDQMVIGHTLSRATHPELTWEPSNWRIECRPCSDASGMTVALDAAARRALTAAGIDPDLDQSPRFPTDPPPPESTPLPVSLSEGAGGAGGGAPDGGASQESRAAGQEALAGPETNTGMGSGGEAVRSAPVTSDRLRVLGPSLPRGMAAGGGTSGSRRLMMLAQV